MKHEYNQDPYKLGFDVDNYYNIHLQLCTIFGKNKTY